MWLWGLAMMALFVVLIVWLVRTVGTDAKRFDSTEATSTRSARAILAERYARGDLSTEEYREREAELR